jgi:hypothetical protein
MPQLQIESEIIDIGVEGTSPYFKINRWGKECSIDFQFNLLALNPVQIGNSVVAENTKYKIEFKSSPIDPQFNETGGLDMIITLKSKPPSNQFPLNCNLNGVKSYHQPPMAQLYKVGDSYMDSWVSSVTDSEVLNGKGIVVVTRDTPYATNSICFYRDKPATYKSLDEADKYRAGIIGVLWRKRAIAANGDWTWANWSIQGDKIILTVDQNFLDTKPYPIILATSTFGYTTTPTANSTSGNANDIVSSSLAYMGAAGTGVSMSGWYRSDSGANVQMGLYDTASPANYITNSSTDNVAAQVGSYALKTANFTIAPTFTAINLYLCCNFANADTGWKFNNGDAGTGQIYASSTFGTWPATIASWSTYGTTVRLFGIYVTYTPAAAGQPTIKRFGGIPYMAINKGVW